MTTQTIAKLEAEAAKGGDKAAKAKAKLEAKRERYRNDPAYLARAIAKSIRNDEHAGKEAALLSVNGFVHWFQGDWAEVRRKNLGEEVLIPDLGKYFPVTCAATACVAGTAVSLAGHTLLVNSLDMYYDDIDDDEVCTAYMCEAPDGTVSEIPHVARELLHLKNYGQHSYLFDARRTKEEVLDVLDKIGRGEYDWEVPEFAEYD